MSQLHHRRREQTVSDDQEVRQEPSRPHEPSHLAGSSSQGHKSGPSHSTPSLDVRAARRKPAPSPLQKVQTPASASSAPTDEDAASAGPSGLPFPRPPTNHPASSSTRAHPTHRAPSREQSHHPTDESPAAHPAGSASQHGRTPGPPSSSSSFPPAVDTDSSDGGARSPQGSRSPTNTGFRPAAASPPRHSSKMSASSLSQQVDAWPGVRKSSIDSAISSIFSQGSASRKSSQDSVTSLTDIANLSSAAGSPEAAIQYLLREKQQSAAQNAQLWRLVDKQRTMILGLNKDLERALHDKEKYRKKLKEHLHLPPSILKIPSGSEAASTSDPGERVAAGGGARRHEASSGGGPTAPSAPEGEGEEQPATSAPDGIHPAHGLTPPASRESSTSERGDRSRGEKVAPLPRRSEPSRMTAAPLSPQNSESAGDVRALSPEEPSPTFHTADVSSWHRDVVEKRPAGPLEQFGCPPAFALSEPSPVTDQMPGHGHSTRKAPPLPLNLAQAKPPGASLRAQEPDDESGSEYDDLPEMQVAHFERGRRRTREEDDRVRETVALQEQERRSRSKKEKSASASAKPGKTGHPAPGLNIAVDVPTDPAPSTDSVPDPTNLLSPVAQSSRLGLPSPLPLATQPGPTGDSSGITHRVLGLSPLSPGLPMSPRPTDRPMNSPRPRLPKEAGMAALASPLVSPRPGFLGLPASPRVSKHAMSSPPTYSMPLVSPGLRRSLTLGQFSEQEPSAPWTDSQSQSAEPKEPASEHEERASLQSTEVSESKSSYPPAAEARVRKEGYLTKRGKNFGGWKMRFFSLDGPLLRYYEAPGGSHLGTIRLKNAQIGKQSPLQSDHSPAQGNDNNPEKEHRHAFLILEPKKKDSSHHVRHVLCAGSEAERDEWVVSLLHYVDESASDDEQTHAAHKPAANDMDRGFEHLKKPSQDIELTVTDHEGVNLLGLSYEDTVQAEAPVRGGVGRPGDPPPSPTPTQSSGSFQRSQISGPTNAVVIHDLEAWGNKPQTSNPTDKKEQRKRSLWGFKTRASSDSQVPSQPSLTGGTGFGQQHIGRNGHARPVFGAPLAEITEIAQPVGVDVYLPAVVYRCIEYLDVKEAAKEEGIFRLSGSSVVIKGLRERFNAEGDVNLLAERHYYDVHAIASLLKMYLRELPASVLTRELHLDFLRVIELDTREKKVETLKALVHKLPRANHSLLRALSAFLMTIVDNSDQNKMTVRNVGIVFSPTLNIPAPVLSIFLTDFNTIFGSDPDDSSTVSVEVAVPTTTMTPADIRSPRRQMFQDLPTPAYHQTSFPKSPRLATAPTPLLGFSPLTVSHEPSTRFSGGGGGGHHHHHHHHHHHQHHQFYAAGQNPPISVVAGQPEYGSLNGVLAPSSHGGNNPHEQRDTKAKRRESSLMGGETGGVRTMMSTTMTTGEGIRGNDITGIVEEEGVPL